MAQITFRNTMEEAGRIALIIRPTMGRLPGSITVENENSVKLHYVVPDTADLKAIISELSIYKQTVVVRHACESYFFIINISNLPF